MVFKLMKLFFLSAALLLMSAATSVAAVAADQNDNCENWAAMGECDNNVAYMYENCATSCDQLEKAAQQTDKELAHITSFYDLEAKDIKGNLIKFEHFRGKVVIIVNVASYCGYTESHYRGLVELWSKIKNENIEILAFPCNQFGAQEPESNDKIEQFAKGKGVEFTMMDKVNVNGPHASLVYKYVKREAGPKAISWNFATYFVVGPDGTINSHNGVEPMGLLQYSLDLLKGDEL